MKSVNQLLNTIKQRHDLKSDYKLALFLGIGESALANYRHERTLPDAAACVKIAAALDLDADLLTVQIEAMRAKTADARQLWERVAQRLQMGFAAIKMMVLIAMVSVAFAAVPALAGVYATASAVSLAKIYIVEYLRRAILTWREFVKKCKTNHVSCKPAPQPAPAP